MIGVSVYDSKKVKCKDSENSYLLQTFDLKVAPTYDGHLGYTDLLKLSLHLVSEGKCKV